MVDRGTGQLVVDFENGGREVMVDTALSALPVPAETPNGPVEHDPQAFNAAMTQAMTSEPEEVYIDGPPDGSVQLLAGYVDEQGTRWPTAEVRELRGRDEEDIERVRVGGDMSRYLDTILRCGVVRIGNVQDTDDKAMLVARDSLLLGDRDLLIMQIRRTTFGDTQTLKVKCPHCEHDFEVEYSYADDVPLRPYGKEDKGQRVFQLDLPSGATATVRLVDGKAQKVVYGADAAKKLPSELNTLLLREVVSHVNGQLVKNVGPIRDMTARDRAFLLKWMTDEQPGPAYEDVKQECPECTREFPLVMEPMLMFRG